MFKFEQLINNYLRTSYDFVANQTEQDARAVADLIPKLDR